MMDQKRNFISLGIPAEFVGEAQCDKEVTQKVLSGSASLVLMSPESIISSPTYRNMLLSKVYKKRIVALVIDEAHCINTW